MRKLLNTLYITNELLYITLDGENIVCKENGDTKFRIPFDNVENIVCFSYIGCSPALMGKCVEKTIPINFISPSGKFWAKVCGETKGNVFLRVAQIDCFRENNIKLAQNTMAAKFSNTAQLIKRSVHDNPELKNDNEIIKTLDVLKSNIEKIYNTDSIDEIMGVEGYCAQTYFSIFNRLIRNKSFKFEYRTKRPPLDEINAVLSFIYTLATSDYAAALETVGLDSYIGYCHTLRSGRVSLACDMVEEFRCIAERFVITLINLKVLNNNDFEKQISGAVMLNDEGRRKVITKWQEKKRTDIIHPYLNQRIPLGLLPYVQANLMAKYVRGDIDSYPPYILKN